MVGERLFYFVHGAVTMYFLMAGFGRLRIKDASRQKRLCGYILLYWGFLELKDLFFYTTPVIRYNYLSNLLIMVDMTAITVGFCFIGELIRARGCRAKSMGYHMIPYVLAIVTYAITDWIWIYNGLFIYTGVYGLCYLIYIYFAVKHYNKILSDNYSDIEFLHVNWLIEAVVMLVVTFAAWVVSCYFTSWIIDSCYQLLLLAMWVIILRHADRQQTPHIAASLPLKLPSDGVLSEALVHKLEVLLSENKIWKNPQLTLMDLAMEVGTNRTYLSNYLNTTLHTTFYDYINSFRLEAAMKLLDDPTSTATMIEIAEMCGFNSISTFRRVFVRAKGCSLTEYRHNLLKAKNEE